MRFLPVQYPISMSTLMAFMIRAYIQNNNRWLVFEKPARLLRADAIEQVAPLIEEISERVRKDRLFAVGFLSYEAAAAFDHHLATWNKSPWPYAWFALFEPPEYIHELPFTDATYALGNWRPLMSETAYQSAADRVMAYLKEGDTYQVNLTYRLRAHFEGDPYAWFLQLARTQRGRHMAYIDTGDDVICSASPELFFTLEGTRITTRPMKGTMPRAYTYKEDLAVAKQLQACPKNRAENVMIVDMLRNDLGKIARPDSVVAAPLFQVEKYPTVWQMTSTIQAETDRSISEIFKALFPCASITGAPKRRTMEIITELENTPRGIYTGCIGYIGPDHTASFNVAIRTAVLDRNTGAMEYGTGGGIVWDSTVNGELAESRVKARIASTDIPEFDLLETMLWTHESGIYLLERHIKRLRESADYFDFVFNEDAVREQLRTATKDLADRPWKVRLTLNRRGILNIELSTCNMQHSTCNIQHATFNVQPATSNIRSDNVFLYHKTTNRELLDRQREASAADDVLLWNERGEITETTIANIMVRHGDIWVTPPVSCGLLAGTLRAELLATGAIQEGIIRIDELSVDSEIRIFNSVRGILAAVLVESKTC